jgi:REP element-mobilizing transposase RayT
MQQFDYLEAGWFYHIYNHGVGGRDLFRETDNYNYFIKLYDKYISPVADTYAWVLMKNHFHLLVRVKENINSSSSPDLTGFQNLSGLGMMNKPPHQHFSNLFNAYSKAFNKRYNTRGALFERPFRRKRIDHPDYLRNVVAYIHNNPVHHGFCSHPIEYPWSSYNTCLSDKTTKLQREDVMEWFGNRHNFEKEHLPVINNFDAINDWLDIEQ